MLKYNWNKEKAKSSFCLVVNHENGLNSPKRYNFNKSNLNISTVSEYVQIAAAFSDLFFAEKAHFELFGQPIFGDVWLHTPSCPIPKQLLSTLQEEGFPKTFDNDLFSGTNLFMLEKNKFQLKYFEARLNLFHRTMTDFGIAFMQSIDFCLFSKNQDFLEYAKESAGACL